MKTIISLLIFSAIVSSLFLLQENLSTEPSKIADDDLPPCCNNIDPFTPSSQNIHEWGYKCNNGPDVRISLSCCKKYVESIWSISPSFIPVPWSQLSGRFLNLNHYKWQGI